MSLHRIGPLSGVLFAPLYAAFTFIPELPEAGYSDERVLALYEPGNASAILAGSAFMALAGLAFLVFLVELYRRVRSDGDGELATLAFGAGLVYVVMLFTAGTLWSGYAAGGGGPLEAAPVLAESVTLARVLTDMGFAVLLLYGLVAASAMVLAASVAGRRTGALPRGVAVAGYVVAPLLLLGFAWVPQFLLPLWVLVVSISLLRSRASRSVRTPLLTHEG